VPADFEALLRGLRHAELEPFLRQRLGEQAGHFPIVIDDQDVPHKTSIGQFASPYRRNRRNPAGRLKVREFPFRPVNVFVTVPPLRDTVSVRVPPSTPVYDRESV
jgi:hypothetical protein